MLSASLLAVVVNHTPAKRMAGWFSECQGTHGKDYQDQWRNPGNLTSRSKISGFVKLDALGYFGSQYRLTQSFRAVVRNNPKTTHVQWDEQIVSCDTGFCCWCWPMRLLGFGSRCSPLCSVSDCSAHEPHWKSLPCGRHITVLINVHQRALSKQNRLALDFTSQLEGVVFYLYDICIFYWG